MTPGRFFWYELATSDRAAAERFYAEVIGWTLSPFGPLDDPYVIVEAAGQGVGGIMTMPVEACASGMKPAWTGYIHVRDIDAAVAGVQSGGGRLLRAPEMIPMVGRFAVCADPQGAPFQLMQPEGEDMPVLPPGTAGTVIWHELHSHDWQAALAFYAGQFGWSAADALDMGPVGTYQMFAMGPVSDDAECTEIAGGMMNDPQAPTPHWTFYVMVEDIDAATARLTGAGGRVCFGPQEVPGGLWVVNALDPQGAAFAITGPRR